MPLPDPHTLLAAAFAHHRAGRRDPATTGYRAVLTLAPAAADALHLLGLLERSGGATSRGQTLIRRALAAAPDLAAAWTNRAQGAANGEAEAAIERALALDPALPAALAGAAAALTRQGRPQAAAVLLGGARHLDPGNPVYADAQRRLQATLAAPPAIGTPDTLERIAGYFDDTITTHGATPAGISCSDAASHDAALSRLARILDRHPDNTARVHDIGCGYGRLFEVIRDHPALARGHYWGCDISGKMVEAARARIADPRAAFAVAALPTAAADHTIVSGTYNVRFERGDREWWEFIRTNLLTLTRLSRRGLAFSLLSRHARRRHDALFYADPAAVLDFTLTHISGDAILWHDFADNEFVVLARAPFRVTG